MNRCVIGRFFERIFELVSYWICYGLSWALKFKKLRVKKKGKLMKCSEKLHAKQCSLSLLPAGCAHVR